MFIKSSICGVLTLLSTTSAFALTCAYDYGGTASCAPDTTTAGNCETLGFSKNNVSNCEQYIYCPFDASYKRCASLDCTAYTLSSCPANGYCSSCKAGGYTHFALDGCNTGYVKSGNSCPANPCTGYPLSSCPTGATDCSTCLSGKTNKYKVNGCKDDYTASGNTCVCATTCKDTATVPDNATAVTCATTCKDTATVPDNATAVTETCTACGVDTEIITGFTCNDGYVKVNDTCQKAYASCEDAGYFTDDTNRDCSSTATIYLTDGKTTECYTSCSCKSGYTASGNTCVAAACSAPDIRFPAVRVTVNVLPANPDLLININLIPVIQVTSNPETPALKSKKNVRTDNIITAENAQIVTRFSQIVKKIVIISMIMILIFKAAIKNAIINTVPACQPQPLTVMITATESALL